MIELLIALLLGLGVGFIAGQEWALRIVEGWFDQNAGRFRWQEPPFDE